MSFVMNKTKKTLQSVTLFSSAIFSDCIKSISDSGKRLVFIIDDNHRLLGSISDGDIRRALLSGVGQSRPVKEIMNHRPLVAGSSKNKRYLLDQMKRKKINGIPIVDENGTLIDAVFLEDLIDKKKVAASVLIMAGGFGKRMAPLTDDTPKPMLPVGGVPMLEIIIKKCVSHGFDNFYVATHYRDEIIKNYFERGKRFGVSIEYLHEDKPRGTAGAISSVSKLRGPLLVLNGDVITNADLSELMRTHQETEADITVAVGSYTVDIPYGIVKTEFNNVLSVEEKPKRKFWIASGIYAFSAEFINGLDHHSYLDMPILINKAIIDKYVVKAFPLHEDWRDLGNLEEYNNINQLYRADNF
jgi:dTDP-glucose pyrophosphorylase/predicted transcriptional regulator